MRTPAAILLLAACSTSRVGPTPDTPTPTDPTGPTDGATPPGWTTDTGSPLPPCDPALTIAPETAVAPPSGLVQFTGAGGTGEYLYALAPGATGTIHSQFGSWFASDVPGAVDTIVLTDAGCAGEARATATVVADLTVQPSSATVLPGTTFTFEATGGSGSIGCTALSAPSGATLAGCTYTAGAVAGTDFVRVADPVTGDAVDAVIAVDPDATWWIEGTERWFVPLGAELRPAVHGGSGVLDVAIVSGAGPVPVDGGVRGDVAGDAVISVTDRFAGWSALVDVTVVAPAVPASARVGLRTLTGEVEWAGDLDGDGYDDAVLGFVELSVDAFQGGGLLVYRGGPAGLDPVPARTIAGGWSYDYVGRSVLVRDLDADGHLDLVVGSDAADTGFGDQGAVYVYYGVPGQLFADEPDTVLLGNLGGDRLGSSVAACDFDGDGFQDLAVGSYGVEDRSELVYPTDTGGVQVFLGGPGGFGTAPAAVRYGRLPDGLGGWTGFTGTNFGNLGLAAGDFDGDGACDVAIGAPVAPWDGITSGDPGVVEMYAGDPVDVLSPYPVATWANLDPLDTNGNFGREIAMGDLDGDGLADLAVGHYNDDVPLGSVGSVKVWLGHAFDGDPLVPYAAAAPDWRWRGPTSSDYAGLDLEVVDRTGDGLADLFVSAPNADDLLADPDVLSVGVILGFEGAAIASYPIPYEATDADAFVRFAGTETGGYFGQAFATLPDSTGDGLPEVFALAGRSDLYGLDVGAPAWVASDAAIPRVIAELPGDASGQEHGRGLALLDGDGDGDGDLFVGSPGDTHAAHGYNAGTVTSFAWTGNALDPAGVGFALDTPNVDGGERRGQRLAALDFDGDGWQDLAVLSQNESKPTSFDAVAYTNEAECPAIAGTGSTLGAVRVYRGSAAGLVAYPKWVWYGPIERGSLRQLAAGDVNGDGRDDLVVGANAWSNGVSTVGGFAVLTGRGASDPAGTNTDVICDPGDAWLGLEASANLGESVAYLGDLDGDGCGELAVGAPLEDVAPGVSSNRGVVRVVYGWGAGCDAGIRVVALAATPSNAQAGHAIAASGDVDGDGLPDLLVGGPGYKADLEEVGAAWLVPGSWIDSLAPAWTSEGGALPALAAATIVPLDGLADRFVTGTTPLGRFGRQVAVVHDGGGAWLAVGAPDGAAGSGDQTGGVWLYRWRADAGQGIPGIDPVPAGLLGGESAPFGDLGEVLVGGDGALAVGAPWSSADGTMTGAAYLLPFE